LGEEKKKTRNMQEPTILVRKEQKGSLRWGFIAVYGVAWETKQKEVEKPAGPK